MKNQIKTIAFDADDTLWANITFFHEAEMEFCDLMKAYLPQNEALNELMKIEFVNLPLYGYGIKGFMLSMIEAANHITKGDVPITLAAKVIHIGKEMINKPVVLLDGVTNTLSALKGHYRLVVATKGDLLDQERKLIKSGLLDYFHHIEIMSDKKVADYQKLIKHLDCRPENFLMIGDSVKSDILPVLDIGGFAAHIPYHITWIHEQHEDQVVHPNFIALSSISEILNYVNHDEN